MSGLKVGSSLRTLVLTPKKIPDFRIPSLSPRLLLSPRPHRISPDRTRLLSDPDDDDDDSPGAASSATGTAHRFLLRLPSPRTRRARAPAASERMDTDLTTRAAMSLSHVAKVTTPYGFSAVLAASPCTRRRESLFHQNKPKVTVTNCDLHDPVSPSPGPGPVKAVGLLKKPAAALRALSPGGRRPRPC